MPESKRLALVIGCGSYDDPTLQTLEASLEDISALESVLKDSEICQFEDCGSIVDRSKWQVEREVQKFLKSAPYDSTVLLYLSGHGIKDEQGSLYFAQKDTDPDLLESTAVSAEFIRRQMDSCLSERKILILDCCFAGAFPKGSKAGRKTLDLEHQFEADASTGRGFFVISATGEFQYAYSGGKVEETKGKPLPSLFTRHLVHGLSTGEADADDNGIIKVGELFDYLQRKVGRDRPEQTPKMIADVEEDFVIAYAQRKRGEDTIESLIVDPTEAKVGTKRLHQTLSGETIEVTVSRETHDGDEIRMPGLGRPGKHGGPPGDLIFLVHIDKPEPVRGGDLFARASITAEDADKGGAATVKYEGGQLSLPIPPGAEDGQIIEVPGKGMAGKHGGASGSLFVTLDVSGHIPVRGADVAMQLAVTPEQAASGTEKTITTPSNPGFNFRVPAGTPDGARVTVTGLGNPGKHGGQAGDLIVTVRIDYAPAGDQEFILELTADEAATGVVKTITGPWGRLEYAVPKGAEDGQEVRLKQMGSPGAYGRPPSDLVITYSVKKPSPEPIIDLAKTPELNQEEKLERYKKQAPAGPSRRQIAYAAGACLACAAILGIFFHFRKKPEGGTPAGLSQLPPGSLVAPTSPLNAAIGQGSNLVEVTTYAGSQTVSGSQDKDGPDALFAKGISLCADSTGGVYAADQNNHCIRRIDRDGSVITIAGSSSSGSADGNGNVARFNAPDAIVINPNDDHELFVADYTAGTIRRLELKPSGSANDAFDWDVSTIVGSSLIATKNTTSGVAASVILDGPAALAIDSAGSLFVSELNAQRIREITFNKEGKSHLRSDGYNWNIRTLAGDPNSTTGYVNDLGDKARFNYPDGLTCDKLGNLYVADTSNNVIRQISPLGFVSTFAGTGAKGYKDGDRTTAEFHGPTDITVGSDGYFYVADCDNFVIRRISPNGDVATVAGTGRAGKQDGLGMQAEFNYPFRVSMGEAGALYVAGSPYVTDPDCSITRIENVPFAVATGAVSVVGTWTVVGKDTNGVVTFRPDGTLVTDATTGASTEESMASYNLTGDILAVRLTSRRIILAPNASDKEKQDAARENGETLSDSQKEADVAKITWVNKDSFTLEERNESSPVTFIRKKT